MILINDNRLILILLVVLLLFAIGNEFAIHNVGLLTGDYVEILNNKDKSAFTRQTVKSILLIIGKL